MRWRTEILAILTVAVLLGANARGAAAPSASEPATDKSDVVTTFFGDRLQGTVVTMESGSALRLKGGPFDGEIAVRSGAVSTLTLAGAEFAAAAPNEVLLAGGGRIMGTLSAISPTEVVVESPVAGRLKIQRSAVVASGPGSVLLASEFDLGRMDPWEGGAQSQFWSLTDGVLVCTTSPGSPPLVRAKLEQKEALTMVADVEVPEGQTLQAFMNVFVDGVGVGGSPWGGRSCVYANFSNYGINVAHVAAGSARELLRQPAQALTSKVQLRLAYDPATGKAYAWAGSQGGTEVVIPGHPTTGQYVQFTANTLGTKIRSLKVLRGIVPPTDASDGPVANPSDETVVEFSNHDSVVASQVIMADGQVTLTTSVGEVRCPADALTRIRFGRKDGAKPAPAKGEVEVSGSFGRLTFQTVRLAADEVVGRSAALGEVHLRRQAVRQIKFPEPAAK
jgi:hypothetical protein